MNEYILEPAINVEVMDRANVLVIGAGPAGCAAAIAAARAGAGRVILAERYNHLGGMATGGQVILIPSLSYKKTMMIKGIMLEALEKLSSIKNGFFGPSRDIMGSEKPSDVEHWKPYFNMTRNEHVCYGGYTDPEIFKIVLQQMIEDAGVIVYLHCWGCRAIGQGGIVHGVCFESKEGRKAILADTVIDCTGDGDIAASAGASFRHAYHDGLRNASLGLVYRLGIEDFQKFTDYTVVDREGWKLHNKKLNEISGFPIVLFPTGQSNVAWVDNWLLGYDCLNVKDLTTVEFRVRRTIFDVIEYVNNNKIPGLYPMTLYDTAYQTGTRGSRRILCNKELSIQDVYKGTSFDDVVAVLPSIEVITVKGGLDEIYPEKPTQIPLGALQVKNMKNLLVAGRCFSSDAQANNLINLIPHCFAMGQAAGVACAVAVRSGTEVSNVNYVEVREELLCQGVYLPDGEK